MACASLGTVVLLAVSVAAAAAPLDAASLVQAEVRVGKRGRLGFSEEEMKQTFGICRLLGSSIADLTLRVCGKNVTEKAMCRPTGLQLTELYTRLNRAANTSDIVLGTDTVQDLHDLVNASWGLKAFWPSFDAAWNYSQSKDPTYHVVAFDDLLKKTGMSSRMLKLADADNSGGPLSREESMAILHTGLYVGLASRGVITKPNFDTPPDGGGFVLALWLGVINQTVVDHAALVANGTINETITTTLVAPVPSEDGATALSPRRVLISAAVLVFFGLASR